MKVKEVIRRDILKRNAWVWIQELRLQTDRASAAHTIHRRHQW